MINAIGMTQIQSSLEIYDIEKKEREVILLENDHFEAPNWSRDGQFLIFNSHGNLYKFELITRVKKQIFTGSANQINNDHGITFDGSQIVISNNDHPEQIGYNTTGPTSRIYILPIEGGEPKLITEKAPSYWHGLSPDGQKLVYVAKRSNDFDIYEISVTGGEEKQLTSSVGLDDGPEYSYDGNHIYYNSMKSGKMEIWRMNSDGSHKTQLTNDIYSNWFPHPSPDGGELVYLSYLEDQGAAHPPMKDVALKLFDLNTREITTLCEFTGGQGTINVPSWSPDGKKFAFVSYKALD